MQSIEYISPSLLMTLKGQNQWFELGLEIYGMLVYLKVWRDRFIHCRRVDLLQVELIATAVIQLQFPTHV